MINQPWMRFRGTRPLKRRSQRPRRDEQTVGDACVGSVDFDAEEVCFDELAERRFARGAIDAAQPPHLIGRKRQPGHLQVLRANAFQRLLLRCHGRTCITRSSDSSEGRSCDYTARDEGAGDGAQRPPGEGVRWLIRRASTPARDTCGPLSVTARDHHPVGATGRSTCDDHRTTAAAEISGETRTRFATWC